jgi:hypothetical protein
MGKKLLLGSLVGSGTLYLFKDYIGEAMDKGLKSLMSGVAEKAFPGISQTKAFGYYMEKMQSVNQQLGINIATGLFLTLGIPALLALGGYLIAKYLE